MCVIIVKLGHNFMFYSGPRLNCQRGAFQLFYKAKLVQVYIIFLLICGLDMLHHLLALLVCYTICVYNKILRSLLSFGFFIHEKKSAQIFSICCCICTKFICLSFFLYIMIFVCFLADKVIYIKDNYLLHMADKVIYI